MTTTIKAQSPRSRGQKSTGKADPSGRLPAELRPICQKLKKLVRGHEQKYLSQAYKIGQAVRHDLDRLEAENGTKYGAKIVDRLAKAAGVNPRTLHDTLRLVRDYSPAGFERLVARKGMTWGHFVLLLTVEKSAGRDALEEQIEAESWTIAELRAAIKRLHGGNRRQGSGRRPRIPTTPSKAIGCLHEAASSFRALSSEALFSKEFDLPIVLGKLAPEEITSEMRDELATVTELLEDLAVDSAKNADRLIEALEVIDAKLAAQQTPPDSEFDDAAEESLEQNDGESAEEPDGESCVGPFGVFEMEEAEHGQQN